MGDLMQWLDTMEVSTQASVLESILIGKRGTVQMRFHCIKKGKDDWRSDSPSSPIQPNSPPSSHYLTPVTSPISASFPGHVKSRYRNEASS